MKLVITTIFIVLAITSAVLGKTVADTLCFPVVLLMLALMTLLIDCYEHPRRWML